MKTSLRFGLFQSVVTSFHFVRPPSKACLTYSRRGCSCWEWCIFDASALWNLSCFIQSAAALFLSRLMLSRNWRHQARTAALYSVQIDSNLHVAALTSKDDNGLKISRVKQQITLHGALLASNFALVYGCSVFSPPKLELPDPHGAPCTATLQIQHKRTKKKSFKWNTSKLHPIM